MNRRRLTRWWRWRRLAVLLALGAVSAVLAAAPSMTWAWVLWSRIGAMA